MGSYRKGRINESVAEEVSLILRDVKDPRVSDGMITVTGAEVTPDLKYAKIFFSFYEGDEKEILRGLRSAAGYIRMQLAQRLNLRATPELTFVHDTSVAHGAHIADLISRLTFSDDAEASDDNT